MTTPTDMSWFTKLLEVLPNIRTRLQLSGLVVAVAAVVATRAVVPQAVNAQLSAGAIGVLFIVFGQVFSSLKDFPEHERSRLVLVLFGFFCVFVVTLVVTTGLFVSRAGATNPTDKVVTFGLSGSFDNGYTYSPASTVTLDVTTGLEVSADVTIEETGEIFSGQPVYQISSNWEWENQGTFKGSLQLQNPAAFVGFTGGFLPHAAYWTPSLGHNVISKNTYLRRTNPSISR
jgi:hypothetical protein